MNIHPKRRMGDSKMPVDGFIKIYRKLQQSAMYLALNSKQRDVMMQCLLLANHTGKEWEWNGDVYKCNPGQFITSLDSLKKVCAPDVKTQSIRTALLKLEKWQFLTNESTKTGRLITIINWDTYQGYEKELTNESTKSQQSTNKELTTNKNVKNVKNKERKNIKKENPPPLQDVINFFLEKGFSESLARKAYEYYEAGGWKDSRGTPVRSWKQKMLSVWMKPENKTDEPPRRKQKAFEDLFK